MMYGTKTYSEGANILDSEVGLVTKTYEVTSSMATNGIIKKGTPIPSNDGNAVGLLFEDVDMSNDTSRIAAIIVQGRIIEANLPVSLETTAKNALAQIVLK